MNTYKRHRFPPAIISYAVWLNHRFILCHRDEDQNDEVVDVYLQAKRNGAAAKRFFKCVY